MSLFEISGLQIDLEHKAMHAQMAEAFRDGSFEVEESRLVQSILKEGHRVIEIGTCTGYVAMVAAKVVGPHNVFSYEANPAAVELAKHHFEVNRTPIDISNAILWPRSDYDPSEKTKPFPIAAALVSSTLLRAKSRPMVDVPVLCLEDEIARRDANFMIIDIEGAEVRLLTSADLSSIDGIIMETHYRKAGERETNLMVKSLYDKGLSIHLGFSGEEVIYFYRDAK